MPASLLPGVRAGPAGCRHLDITRQVLPGGAPQEQALHEHHLCRPGLLHPPHPPLRLWLVRGHQGDQVLPPDLLRGSAPSLRHPHGRRCPRLRLQGTGKNYSRQMSPLREDKISYFSGIIYHYRLAECNIVESID